MSHIGHIRAQPRPLISIVIPIFNVEHYLTECLDSITQQKYDNIEIIAVDGASEDTSGRILDDRLAKEPRLKVRHEGRIGPGRARNIGAQCATGDYIWFVDADDIIATDCLSAIANHIETTSPDLLFIDYEALHSDGKSEPGFGYDLMTSTTEKFFTLAEQPWVINFSMATWNKIVRRDFFFSASVAFSPYWPHEDIPVSCLLLLEASRLSILNHVCYRYRQDRLGSAMLSGEAKRHFNIFQSYATVFCEVEKRVSDSNLAMTPEIYSALFERAIWHYTTIFDKVGPGIGSVGLSGLVARHNRHEFFNRMHSDYGRYVPADYRQPAGLRGIKFRLIAGNNYWIYSILDPVNKLRIALRQCTPVTRHRLTQSGQ